MIRTPYSPFVETPKFMAFPSPFLLFRPCSSSSQVNDASHQENCYATIQINPTNSLGYILAPLETERNCAQFRNAR